jgi:hypothetical protein
MPARSRSAGGRDQLGLDLPAALDRQADGIRLRASGHELPLRNSCRESRLSDIVAQALASLNLMLKGGCA